jgi:hypothetical protein
MFRKEKKRKMKIIKKRGGGLVYVLKLRISVGWNCVFLAMFYLDDIVLETNIHILILLKQPTLANKVVHLLLYKTHHIIHKTHSAKRNTAQNKWNTYILESRCIAINPHFMLHLPRIFRKLSFSKHVTPWVHTRLLPMHCFTKPLSFILNKITL